MKSVLLASLCLGAMALPTAAQAQVPVVQTINGTRLDLSITGEVSRVPDIANISAGVVTRAQSATAAISQNATRMERVRAALKRAGIEDRDIQTNSINLNPEYRYQDNHAPVLTGYTATNQVSIRFRDIRNSGKILDALVAEGANQINGPNLSIDRPEAALDEARTKALAAGRARAELYARSLGLRVGKLISVSESGGYSVPQPMVVSRMAVAEAASTKIDPGEQQVQVTLAMTFELQ